MERYIPVLLAVFAVVLPSARPGNATAINVPADYATIQEAIDAAEGDLDAAIETGSAMLDDSPTELGAIYAEMDVLRLEMDRDAANTDALEHIANRLSDLEGSIDAAAERDRTAKHLPPSEFYLHAAAPNPFNGVTMLYYALPEDASISIKMFDLSGRELATLANGSMAAGRYRVRWNAQDVPSGTYLCRLKSPRFGQTVKLTLIR